MNGKGIIQNFNVWKKEKFKIPVFGKAKIQNSSVWERAKIRIPMFGKKQNLELQCLEEGSLSIRRFWGERGKMEEKKGES